MNLTVCNLSDLYSAAKAIIDFYPDNRVFALYGQMGVGKTTLIKEFCSYLGVFDNVTSPTFAIVNQYTTSSKDLIYHFDFYRIKNISEVYDLGYEDYFYGGDYCFIEWPELVDGLLPESYVIIKIEEKDNTRIITTEKHTQ